MVSSAATGTSGAPVKTGYLVFGTPITVAAGDAINCFLQACPATTTTLYSEIALLVELNY